MRYRLDESHFPEMPLPPRSDSLEKEFDRLLAKIDEVRKQFDVGIVAAEEARTAVHAMRNDKRVTVLEARL
jgi:hypothetical protein